MLGSWSLPVTTRTRPGRDAAGFVSDAKSIAMSDLIFVALSIVFFVAGAAYVAACRRLE